ncbi:GTP-binding protein [Escherichia coli]
MNTALAQQIANEGDVKAWMIARPTMKPMILTCGSVDDGKSTLIGRLLHDTRQIYEDQLSSLHNDSKRHGTQGEKLDLALLVDGLQAEREQGVVIDVAYRYFSTEKRKFIIADTPGHEQYTRNMATGASTCELAILLIDARKGVLNQTVVTVLSPSRWGSNIWSWRSTEWIWWITVKRRSPVFVKII